VATYTVGLPHGIRDFEYADYIRLLEKDGVNIVDTSRVVDPVSGQRWLHAWENEADAEAFALALREESEYDKWRVYALPDVEPTRGPLGPIDIRFTQRSDGYFYCLSLLGEKLILKRFPQTHLVHTVFLSDDPAPDSEQTRSRIWRSIVEILTGLSEEQLEQLGGCRIIDHKTKRFLRETPLVTPADSDTRSTLPVSPPATSPATSILDQSRRTG
jgi:hypothetical protein